MNNNARKRKRDKEALERLKSYGVDLPDIPGIPVQIIPLHLYAVKSTAKYFKHNCCDEYIIIGSEQEQQQQHTEGSNLLHSLLDRVQNNNNDAERQNDEEKQNDAPNDKNISQTMQQSIDAWLDAIRREAKSNKKSNVPSAVTEHLWSLLVDSSKSSLRRAALHLIAKLAAKSAQARQWLFQDSNHHKWLEWMNDKNNNCSNKDNTFLHHEVYGMLKYLDEYNKHYTAITVLQRRMVQIWPHVGAAMISKDNDSMQNGNGNYNVADYRKWRDAAMKHFEREERSLLDLLNQCDACLDCLMPRFGQENEPKVKDNDKDIKVATLFNSNDIEGAADDDDSIDWEDGLDDTDPDNFFSTDNNNNSHQAAVDQALSVLEATGRLQDGALTIDMTTKDDDNSITTGSNKNNDNTITDKATSDLQKYVDLLRKKHLQRISCWIQGLIHADNLQQQNSSVYVSMSRADQERRSLILRRLNECKQNVTSTINAAKRIGIDEGRAVNGDDQVTSNNNNSQTTLRGRPPNQRPNIKRPKVKIVYKR